MPYEKIHRPLNDPSFPHGTVTGCNWGCRRNADCTATPTCAQAKARHAKKAKYRREHNLRADKDMLPLSCVRPHVLKLLAVPHSKPIDIARLAGVSGNAVAHVVHGKYQSVRVAIARKLLAVTVRQVQERVPRSVTRRHVQLIKSMQVQGWSLKWQAEQLGHAPSWLKRVATHPAPPPLTAEDEAALIALADHCEGKWGPDKNAAAKARNEGWHPLPAYDDRGELIVGAIRKDREETRKALQDEAAQLRISALAMSLRGVAPRDVCARLDITRSLLQKKILREAGLSFDTQSAPDGQVVVELNPACTKRAAWMLDEIRTFEIDNEADPVELVLQFGLRSGLRLTMAELAAARAMPVAGPAVDTDDDAADDTAPAELATAA